MDQPDQAKPTDPDLSLIDTDTLFNEIDKRFDGYVFMGQRLRGGHTDNISYGDGPIALGLGLTELLRLHFTKMFNKDHPIVEEM